MIVHACHISAEIIKTFMQIICDISNNNMLTPQAFKVPNLPRELPFGEFLLKKLSVMSYRLSPIFDFHSSLTEPPGMPLFKDAFPAPQTTATVAERSGQLYRFIDF